VPAFIQYGAITLKVKPKFQLIFSIFYVHEHDLGQY